MENINTLEELTINDQIDIIGGGSGSENGAFIAGRIVGLAIGGPIAGIYYAGCDWGLW